MTWTLTKSRYNLKYKIKLQNQKLKEYTSTNLLSNLKKTSNEN